MKHIFPKQFGLQNVFTGIRHSRSRDEMEDVPKIPKRLRGRPVELVQRLQRRHKNCSYAELLRYYCPEVCRLSTS